MVRQFCDTGLIIQIGKVCDLHFLFLAIEKIN